VFDGVGWYSDENISTNGAGSPAPAPIHLLNACWVADSFRILSDGSEREFYFDLVILRTGSAPQGNYMRLPFVFRR
jgi:hypothetical protein